MLMAAKPEPKNEEKGLCCPRCGCAHAVASDTAKVWYTRPSKYCIRRSRICRNCGNNFGTVERVTS